MKITSFPTALLLERDVNFDGVNARQWSGYLSPRRNNPLSPHRRHYYQSGLYLLSFLSDETKIKQHTSSKKELCETGEIWES